ncbi:MAG: hypothetical protein MUC85_01990 [Anaerolineales bacterium]|jgi:hypothetical protein|nr:hypothetical protein [Anaerolineales bacterium]
MEVEESEKKETSSDLEHNLPKQEQPKGAQPAPEEKNSVPEKEGTKPEKSSGEPDMGDAKSPSGGKETESGKKSPPVEDKSKDIRAEEIQKTQRRENVDYMRVLGQYGGGGIPLAYIEHLSVANDLNMGGTTTVGTEVSPTAGRESLGVAISARELDKVQQVFQQPAAFQAALDALKNYQLLALSGRMNVGKRTAAIAMASELCCGTTIWDLSPEEDPSKQVALLFSAAEARPGMVMIVDGLLSDTARALTAHTVKSIKEQLERKRAYLIICIQPDVRMPAEVKRVSLDTPPVSAEILVQVHTSYYLNGVSETKRQNAEEALNQERIQKIIREEQLTPRQADALVERIVSSVQYNLDVEQAIQFVLSDFLDDEVSEWIGETADNPEECAFRISLAVFSGWLMADILDASKDLKDLLFPPPPEKERKGSNNTTPVPAPISPLRKSASGLLQRARAKRVKRVHITEYSENAMLEVVELENSGYSKALLRYLWKEIYEWQEPLLKWLTEKATYGPEEMRSRAAGAIGSLASLDFDGIRRRIFVPWGFADLDEPGKRRRQYQALAKSLGVLIWDDVQKENILGLLSYWTDQSNIALKWAAARAYSAVGLRYPREAVQQWRKILQSEGELILELTYELGIRIGAGIHQDFVQSVLDSIIKLFSQAVEVPHSLRPVYEQAITALADWVELDEQDESENNSGLALFVLLSDIRYPPEDGSGEQEDWPPAMLYVASAQPDGPYRLALATLLRKALGHSDSDFSDAAAVALKDWVNSAEEREWLYDALLNVLLKLLSLPKIRQSEYGRLWRYLYSWANPPGRRNAVDLPGKKNVSQRLLDTLNLGR